MVMNLNTDGIKRNMYGEIDKLIEKSYQRGLQDGENSKFSNITEEQAIKHLTLTGWLRKHDEETKNLTYNNGYAQGCRFQALHDHEIVEGDEVVDNKGRRMIVEWIESPLSIHVVTEEGERLRLRFCNSSDIRSLKFTGKHHLTFQEIIRQGNEGQ